MRAFLEGNTWRLRSSSVSMRGQAHTRLRMRSAACTCVMGGNSADGGGGSSAVRNTDGGAVSCGRKRAEPRVGIGPAASLSRSRCSRSRSFSVRFSRLAWS